MSQKGVHAPTTAGISGTQSQGAKSVVCSGKYEDDGDNGDVMYVLLSFSSIHVLSRVQPLYRNRWVPVGDHFFQQCLYDLQAENMILST